MDKLIIFNIAISSSINREEYKNIVASFTQQFKACESPGYKIKYIYSTVSESRRNPISITLLYPPALSFIAAEDLMDLEEKYANIPSDVLDLIKKEIAEREV